MKNASHVDISGVSRDLRTSANTTRSYILWTCISEKLPHVCQPISDLLKSLAQRDEQGSRREEENSIAQEICFFINPSQGDHLQGNGIHR